MAGIEFEQVVKVFPDGTCAVDEVSLDVEDGRFLVLVGPSGCGKTTLLRMTAGLETVTGGRIRIGGHEVNDVPPKDRDIAMVFQNYALYPHMSVRDNLGFSLKLQRQPRAEIDTRVSDAAGLLGLKQYLDRRPRELSGGQRQRVAMGRAIVRKPQAFLMDEPLSNLDAQLRIQMRAEIAKLQHDLGVTTIYVTHDQTEAMTLGDTVAIMRDGRVRQVGPPEDIYREPVDMFVAGFIGAPAMNFLRARVTSQPDGTVLTSGAMQLALSGQPPAQRSALAAYADREVAVGVRSESLAQLIGSDAGDGGTYIEGTVVLREHLGSDVLAHLNVGADVIHPGDGEESAGAEAAGAGVAQIIARLGGRVEVAMDDRIRIAVKPTDLHFFDLDTGLRIAT